ncbi:MAG: M24 family metallopeptidase [Candidatus Thorarchaeota archaeon]
MQQRLQKEQLDGALIFSVPCLYYFTGIGVDGALYVPSEANPTHLVRRNIILAREYSQIDSIINLAKFSDLFDHLDIPNHSQLIIEKDVMPVSRYEYLARLSRNQYEFQDGSLLLRQLRSIKTEFELLQIRTAAQLIDRMFTFCVEHVTPEMTEIELASGLNSWLFKNGHAGHVTTRAFNALNLQYPYVVSSASATSNILFTPISGHGLSAKYPFGGSTRKLGKNTPFFIDACGNHNGYISDTTRTFICGQFNKNTQDHLESLQTIKNFITSNLRPGKSLGQLFGAVMELSKELGIYEHFMGYQADKSPFLGHGVGLELDELPIFYKKGPCLETGHVLASEPKFIDPNLMALGIEDTYAINNSGNRVLTQAADYFEI